MATLQDLKAQLDVDPDQAAVRTTSVLGAITSIVVYRDLDDFYVVTDLEGDHKECWHNWQYTLDAVGAEWAEAEDWTIRPRESGEDLLTLQYVAKRLKVSEDTIRRWAKSGAVDALPLPMSGEYQSYRIRRTTLQNLLRKKSPVVAKAS
jgi:excisionase family DNA binding protein